MLELGLGAQPGQERIWHNWRCGPETRRDDVIGSIPDIVISKGTSLAPIPLNAVVVGQKDAHVASGRCMTIEQAAIPRHSVVRRAKYTFDACAWTFCASRPAAARGL